MKVKLIYPRVIKGDTDVYLPYLWFPLITFPILAAYTPPDVEVEIIDEVIEDIDFDDPVDLVGLTAMTYSVHRAYEIAGEYRKRGVKVVMGGFHATAQPAEVKEYVDAVVTGEGEETWPRVIEDFKKGALKPYYASETYFDMARYKTPRLELLSRYCPPYEKYTPPFYPTLNIVEMSRGCPFECDFCAVTNFHGKKYRFRPVADVLNEIRYRKLQSRQRHISINDDNVFGSKTYFRELLQGLKKLNITWGAQMSINVAKDPEMLDLLVDSGCQSIGFGLETLSQQSLDSVHKVTNKVAEYDEIFQRVRNYKLRIFLGMMVGLDYDDESIFEKTLAWLKTQLDVVIFANIHIITPFPGTALHQRLMKENRLIDFDWKNYDTRHVVFKPRLMSEETLYQGFKWLLDNMREVNLENWKQWYIK
ncbi:MAG: radical SAM protein [Candidatus Aminicenantes bacterium]|nr:radical SAM protein [Candidatus Aminicenantes bacterium]